MRDPREPHHPNPALVSGPHRFAVDGGRDLDDLVAGLAARGLARDADRVVDRTVYDTFDWRLWRRGTRLEHEVVVPERPRRGAEADTPWLVWRAIDSGEVLGRLAVARVPTFAGHLPDGPTADRLAAVVEMRALLPLTTVHSRQVGLVSTDDEGKVQARVLIDQATGPDDQPLTTVVEVIPVRGYPRAAAQVTDLLSAQVVLEPVADDAVDQALDRLGLHPGSYSSKLSLTLDPGGSALDAVATVVATLLGTMAANLAGTVADTDSEFLHDFRVAVRRTRSVLGMATDVVPPDLLGQLRAGFKWLGDITTPTRDLDVYLLDFDQFEAAVGPARRGDLASLRSFLVERQRQAHRQLVEGLESDRYPQLIDLASAWAADPRGVAGATDADLVPLADQPAPELAAARTWKAYRRLVRDGRRITPESPPTALHDLRKDAKKLRYTLECFGSLFDAEDIALGVKELKGVQDVLGTFQDCEVQKASLASLAAELIDERGASQAATLLAMGTLVERLDEREATARAAFADRFDRFDDAVVRARFRRLFRPDDDHAASDRGA